MALDDSGDDGDIMLGVIDTSNDDDDEYGMMPDLTTMSSLSDGSMDDQLCDWDDSNGEAFSKVGDNAESPWGTGQDSEELSGLNNESSCLSFIEINLDSDGEMSQDGTCDSPNVPIGPDGVAFVNDGPATADASQTVLFNSGSTCHIFLYCTSFQEYCDIPPKSLSTANMSDFIAVGRENMCIEVPNGMVLSKLYLTKVLFSPKVGYMLVSIGQLDQCNYTTTFGGSSCTIQNENNSIVGQIPCSPQGIYHVSIDPTESTSVAVETLTPMEIHHRMGHISLTIAVKLIKDGLVTGIWICNMPSVDLEFCKSCIYAKATHKPIAKARKGEHTSTFGKKVHLDLWGPAPVATL